MNLFLWHALIAFALIRPQLVDSLENFFSDKTSQAEVIIFFFLNGTSRKKNVYAKKGEFH